MNRKTEFLASIKPILEKQEAKKDAIKLAQELGDILSEINVDADGGGLTELKEVFNAQLAEMGKQPIIFSENTLKGITAQFANAVSEGVKAGITEGGNIINSGLVSQLDELINQKNKLQAEAKKITDKYEKFEHYTEITSIDMDEDIKPLKLESDDVDEQALSLMDSFIAAQDALYSLKQGTQEYEQTLIDAVEAGEKLFQMRLSLEKHKPSVHDPSILEDYNLINLTDTTSYVFDTAESYFSRKLETWDWHGEEKKISRELDKIERQINDIQKNNADIFNQAQAEKALKTLEEIDEAYKRISTKQGALRKVPAHNLQVAIGQEEETRTLTQLRNDYNKIKDTGNWEDIYTVIARFVNKFESELQTGNISKDRLPEYTRLYDEFAPIIDSVRTALGSLIHHTVSVANPQMNGSNRAVQKPDLGKNNTRRKELTQQLDEYSGDVLDSQTADNNIKKRKEIFKLLQNEGLLTDEIKRKYDEVNKRLEIRAGLIRKAEFYYDDIEDVLGANVRVDAIDSEEQYRKDHLYPFDRVVDEMRDSGVFSEEELENSFYQVLETMESYAQDIGVKSAFDELDNRVINPEDITDVNELNRLLQERQDIIERTGDYYLEQYDSSAYEDAVQLNNAIKERIQFLQKAQELSLADQYNNAPEAVKKIVDEMAVLEHQMNTLKERTAGTTLDGFFKFDPSDEHKAYILNAFKEYERVIKEISEHPIVETEDDKKRLIELKEEAARLGATLHQAYLNDGNAEDYARAYGISIDYARELRKVVDNDGRQWRNEADVLLRNDHYNLFEALNTADNNLLQTILNKSSQWEELSKTIVSSVSTATSTRQGDASSAEVDSLRQQLEEANRRAHNAEAEAQNERNHRIATEMAYEYTTQDLIDSEGRAHDAEAEADRLRQELAERQGATSGATGDKSDTDIGVETTRMTSLKEAVEAVTEAVGLKTGAFQTEKTEVDKVVDTEVESLGKLESKITTIKEIFEGLVNNIRNGSDDIGAGLSNVNINVNYPENTQATLDQEALNKLADIIKQAQTKTPETAIDAVGKALATENTLLAIKTAVESIDGKTIKGSKVGSDSGRKSTTKQDYQGSPFFGEKLKTREMELAKFAQQLMNKGQDTPKIQDAVKHLKDALKLVNSGERLSVWDQKFRQAKLAVGIDDLKEQPDNKESIQTYKNLIAYAKEYYSLVEKYEKAKNGTDRKATLGKQKQDAEAFMRENGLDLNTLELGDEAYNKRLSDLREKHRKNLEVIGADNRDKVNTQDAKATSTAQKEEADVVKKLIALYKELGQAKARQNSDLFDEDQIAKAYVDEARIRRRIKEQRSSLGAIDKNIGLQFKQAKDEAYATTTTDAKLIADSKARKQKAKDVANANAEALATENKEVDKLSKAYEKLGKLVAARNYATTEEAKNAIQETINKRVKEINSNSRNNFANRDTLTSAFRKSKEETEGTLKIRRADQEGKRREKAEANARKTLTDLSKELGVLEAKSKFVSTVSGKDEYDRQIKEKKAEIEIKKEGIKVDEEELEIARQLAEQKQYNTLALQNSEKRGKADLDTQQKENNHAYERLIKLKETQYNIEKKLLAAEAGSEKESTYKSQLADVEALIDAQRELLYYEDKTYEQKLLDKDAAHQRDIEELIAGQVDTDNKKKQKEKSDSIKTKTKEAMALAKTIGELDAKLDFVDDNDDGTINEYIRQISEKAQDLQQLKEELKLDDDSIDTAIRSASKNKYDSLAPEDSQAKYRKAQSEELRREKQTIKELHDLYKQLGQAEAKRDMIAQNSAQVAKAKEEYDDIEKEINAKRQLIKIDDKLENQFTDSWMSGIEAETKSPIGNLTKAYEKLGELRAKIEQTPAGDYLDFLKRQLVLKSKLLEVESDRLGISQHEKESNRLKAEDVYNSEMFKWQGELAKKRDKERNDEQAKLFKQQTKQSKELAKVNQATSAINKADSTLNLVSSIGGWSGEHVARLNEYSDKLRALKDQYTEIKYSDGVVTADQQEELINQTLNVNKLTEEINELIANYNRLSGENATVLGADTLGSNATIGDYKKQLTDLVMAHTNGRASITGFNAATKELTYTVQTGKYEFTEYTVALRQADGQIVKLEGNTKRLETPMEKLKRKMSEILAYFGGSSLIYEFFGQFRQGVQYVRDIDSALTELKKVTDETEESYDRFLETAAKTADKVGSTITNIVSSTADWAKLGYSMEDAARLAESTSVLLNVSEFSSIEDATSALTSTMQAFGYVAEDSMHVVDVLNEVGNNFAISSDGIATALQDSSSALMAANNSYEEAVALIAAANRVVQDPNSVGAALRTISLRLRGTSVNELEEAGEDTTGVITSKSKLRGKIKTLSGVDILTETGAYKSTYQILLEISKVWGKMNDMDQAALLEILAGKNRANTAMAILSNTTDLEEAYVQALEAEGSAHAENEKYLDSIQGKIDQFNNALQTMWSHTLDDSLVKGVVSLGTELIKLIDKFGLVQTALSAWGLSKFVPWLLKLITGTNTFGSAVKKILVPLAKVDGTGRSIAEMFMFVYKNSATATGGITNLGAALKAAGAALSTFTKTPLGWLTVAAAIIGGIVWAVDKYTTSAKEAAEASKEALSAYESAQDTLKSHKQIIESVSEDYEKLSKGVDQSGNNISLTTDEYARYNEIVNQIAGMFPEMVSGYTAEGNAILTLKGNVEELTNAYKEETAAANQAILASSNDIFDTFKNGYDKDAWNIFQDSGIKQQYTLAKKFVELINQSDYDGIEKLWDDIANTGMSIDGDYYNSIELEDLFESAGVDISEFTNLFGYNLNDQEAFKKNEARLLSYFKTLTSKMNAEVSNVTPIITAYLESDFDYAKLSTETQNIVKNIINGFDAEFYNQFESASDLQAYITENVVKPLQNTNTSAELQAAFDLQTKLNNGEVSIQDYENKIKGIIELIDALDLENEDDIIKSLRLVFEVDDSGSYNVAAQNVAKDLLEDQYDDMVGTLDKSDLDIINQYASEWKINDDTLLSWDELKEKIEAAKQVAETSSITDSLTKISSLEDAFNSLGDAVKEFKEEGTASADTLESLNEVFGTTEGFEDLYKVLATGEGDIAKAVTTVANAYVTKAGILSDLTDEELQIMIARLESLGVLNAQEVLMNRQTAQQQLDDKLQGYNIDLSAYATAEEAKLAIAAQAGLDFSKINDDNLSDLIKTYNIDVNKYKTAAEQKIQIAKEMALETAKANKASAISSLNQEYLGNGYTLSELSRSESYKASKQAIWDEYNAAVALANSVDTTIENIGTIVDDYYSNSFTFDFSGDRIGIGRDFDEEIDTDDKDKEDALEKLRKKYENKIKLLEAQQTYLENEIARMEAEDEQVTKDIYEEQIRLEKEKLALYEEERAALLAAMGTVEKGSDEWYEYANAVWETEHAIQESTLAILEFEQSIVDLYVTAFDKIEEAYDHLENLRNFQIDDINANIEYSELTDQPVYADAYRRVIDVQTKDYYDKLMEAGDLRNARDLAVANSKMEVGDEEWIDFTERIYEAEAGAKELRNSIAETNNEMKQLYVTAFDKVKEAYDALGNLYSDRQSYAEGWMELQELRGEPTSVAAYEYLMSNTEAAIADKTQEIADLEAKLSNAMANGVKEGSEEWVQMQEEIRAADLELQELNINLEQTNQELKDLYYTAFEKIRDSFGDITDIYNDQEAFIESYIDYLETMGVSVPEEVYDKLSGVIEDRQQTNYENLAKLERQFAEMEAEGYTPEDEEWVAAQAALREIEKAIWDDEVAQAELNKRVQEMEIEKFEEYAKRVQDVVDELENLYDLLADEDVANEDGSWTEEGIASLGLLYQKMEIAKKQMADYQEEIEKLNGEYKSGAISEQEYNDRLVELKNSQWDAIDAYEDAKDAIVDINEARVDMIEEGIQEEIDAYQELIDLKKKELDAERDLYDFRKNINNQSKDIAALERKIAAMSGSTDAATIAERTKLEAQLREAQEELNDTYYSHAMDSQSSALDDENEAYVTSKEDYIELLREALEDVEKIVSNTMSQVLINADTVLGTLNDVSGKYGITLSDSLITPWVDAAQKAEDFKNSATMSEYEFAVQNGIFTAELGSDFENLFAQTTFFAEQFNTDVTITMEAIRFMVEEKTSDMQGNMVMPFSDALDYAQNTFSPQTIDALEDVADKARELVIDETNSLTAPWEISKKSITAWGEEAHRVLEQVQQDAVTYDPSDEITDPIDGEGGAIDTYNLFGETVENIFEGLVTTATNNAKKIASQMSSIVSDAQSAANAINNVGSSGSGKNSGSGGGKVETPVVKEPEGYTKADVKALQEVLNTVFNANIAVDGNYGGLTRNAVSEAQLKMYSSGIKSMKLPDGLYGEATRNAMITYMNSAIASWRMMGGSASIGQGVQKYEEAKKKLPKAFYAKGTTGTKQDEWAVTDEIGDELVLIPGKGGNLQYMRKGTAVIPADISSNLMEWGKFNPNMDMVDGVQGINLMTNVISKPEVNLSFDALVKAEHITEETLPAVKKLVTEELEKFSRNLNYSLRRVGAK